MAQKYKSRDISILQESNSFTAILNRFSSEPANYDFDGLAALRKLLSNEKMRLFHVIKVSKPKSIYSLAKILKRDFKSVSEDIKLLQRFGLIDFVSEKSGKRSRLRPVLSVDSLYVRINF